MMVDAKFDNKVEGICMEFTRLLADQLQQQRKNYEKLLQQLQSGAPPLPTTVHRQSSTGPDPYAVFASLDREHNYVACHVQKVLREGERTGEMRRGLQKLLSEESSLMTDNDHLKSETRAAMESNQRAVDVLKAKIVELRDSLREAKVNLETRAKISKSLKGESADGALSFIQDTGKGHRRRK